MEYIIIGIVILILTVILEYMVEYNKKQIEHLGENKELDELAKSYPSNVEMCKDYLKKLNNETVTIEENKGAEASLYIAITNKILIADIQDSYTRIQTIAHECLHSIQSKKLLLFNFIFSNLYFLYFIVICALIVLKMLPYKMMFLVILLLFSMVYYMVRVYLENDAMIKARYLAKEYMQNKKLKK